VRATARGGFFILDGVRRAMACRDAGLKTVPAIVYREGQAPERRPRMRLASLFSPKETVVADRRSLGITPPIEEPISLEPLGARAQPRSVPLAKVRRV
jgi:hypothetical protein